MRKGALILLLGLALGAAAFAGIYLFNTARYRAMLREPQPGLAWLKTEFQLSDAEYSRIAALHEAYLPECGRRCALIEEQNETLRGLLAAGGGVTPEIEELLEARARTRAQCEAQMLRHFREVSRAMPPEQGRRYLAWVEAQTVLQPQPMEARHHPSGPAAPPHHPE